MKKRKKRKEVKRKGREVEEEQISKGNNREVVKIKQKKRNGRRRRRIDKAGHSEAAWHDLTCSLPPPLHTQPSFTSQNTHQDSLPYTDEGAWIKESTTTAYEYVI